MAQRRAVILLLTAAGVGLGIGAASAVPWAGAQGLAASAGAFLLAVVYAQLTKPR